MRIALVFQGDAHDPKSWSGVPVGFLSGFAAAGAEPIAVDASVPGSTRIMRALGMDWMAETTNPILAALAGARVRAGLRRGDFDAVLALGSGYSLRSSLPTTTFDDMTVVQALAQEGSEYDQVGKSAAQRWRRRQLRNYRESDACCVASEWAAQSVVEDYGIDPAKVHVVGFGRNAPPQVVERDWAIPRFLFIGGDWKRKRGQAVVDAFSHLRDRHPLATLDLVGGHPPIDAPGVTGHGFLSLASEEGRQQQKALLARATCMVLPSSFEPFGISYIDAGAAGVPSIGTTSGGAATAIGEGGLLVDPDDDDGLLEAMLAICDPNTAARLGERAFSHSQGFTWQAVAERMLAALKLESVVLNRR